MNATLTLVEAAAYLHHQPGTLYAWRRDGRTDRPLGFTAGRKVLYTVDELDAWLEQQRQADADGMAARAQARSA
jgi:hypothetical protein